MTERSIDRAPLVLALAAFAFTCALFLLVCRAPFLSEDWTQLEAARSIATLRGALSLEREPLRPLQHGFFWILAHSGLDPVSEHAATLARIPASVLHLGAIAAVFALARAFGLRARGAFFACFVFAVAPNVKSLAWPAAIGSPGRVCFELAALAFFAWHARERRFWRGLSGLVCFALALGFHESAMLAPLVFALWLVAGDERGWREGVRNWLRALRDPFVTVFTVGGLLHLVQLAVLRPQRHHGVKSFDALPANVSKAALALFPEPLRGGAIDGLRGEHGNFGLVLGSIALVVVALAFVFAIRHAGALRFAALAIAVDLGLAVVGTGFVQRYAYFSSAIVAIVLAIAVGDALGRRARFAALFVALPWAIDSVVDAVQFARGGEIARGVVALAIEARREAGNEPMALVDLPDMAGGEEDIPLFNWGADLMLAAHRVQGPWLFWRTRGYRTNTNVELVDGERLERARVEGAPRVFMFDSEAGTLTRK